VDVTLLFKGAPPEPKKKDKDRDRARPDSTPGPFGAPGKIEGACYRE
jgi:hypothetical protein